MDADLCGYNSCTDQMYQAITIPKSYATATLTLAIKISTQETTTTTCNDKIYVAMLNAKGAPFFAPSVCNLSVTNGWLQANVDMSTALAPYRGQAAYLYIAAVTNSTLPTNFYLDNLSLTFNSSAPSPELLSNIGFENGLSSWSVSSVGNHAILSTTQAHSPSYSALLCNTNFCNDQLWQTVSIPASYNTLTLSYWYYITTSETTTTLCNDALYVRVRTSTGTTITTPQILCNYNKTTGWVQKTVNLSSTLSAYKGKQVQIYFQGLTNGLYPTSFYLDDVSLRFS